MTNEICFLCCEHLQRELGLCMVHNMCCHCCEHLQRELGLCVTHSMLTSMPHTVVQMYNRERREYYTLRVSAERTPAASMRVEAVHSGMPKAHV